MSLDPTALPFSEIPVAVPLGDAVVLAAEEVGDVVVATVVTAVEEAVVTVVEAAVAVEVVVAMALASSARSQVTWRETVLKVVEATEEVAAAVEVVVA